MRLHLYVVHGSHPCAAVEKAIAIKGLTYKVTEWPPPLQAPIQKALLVPEPPLLPADPAARARVEEAELWGDEIFQPIARELIWAGFRHSPAAMVSYGEHSRLPLPPAAIRVTAPLIARLGAQLNRTDDDVVRSDLRALPTQLDRIDSWIADGTIGDREHPNAADLQLASTVRLMLTFADARLLIESRPCADLARALFPDADGELPAGSLPAA